MVLVVVAVASTIGQRFLATTSAVTMMSWELAPALMVACGSGFVQPVETPQLQEFLSRSRDRISCSEIERQGATPPGLFAVGERYAIYAAGLALRAGGLSWRTLDAYQGVLFGLTMGMAYVILRLVAGPALATLGAVALIWSDQVFALLSFRDFGKAPAFFALWLVLGWIVSRNIDRASVKLLAPAALAGLLVGIGIGFRIDLLVFVPAILAVVSLAVPGFDRRSLYMKAVAGALFIVVSLAAGAPILAPMSTGSNSSHVVVLGLMREFTRNLGLEPPSYDVGDHYSDSQAFSLISAHASAVDGEAGLTFLSARYDAAGAGFLSDMARWFPADAMIRPLGAVTQSIRYPFDGASRGEYLRIAPFNQSSLFRAVGLVRSAVLKIFEGWALVFAALVFAAVALRSSRMAALGIALVAYFCGYSMLQFSRRHSFHLDLVAIGLCVVGARLAFEWVRSVMSSSLTLAMSEARRSLTGSRRVAGAALAVAVVVAGLLWSARWYQQRHVVAALEQTLTVPWSAVPLVPEPFAPPVDPAGTLQEPWLGRVESRHEEWRSAVLFRLPAATASPAPLAADRLSLDYLQIEVNAGCGAPSVAVGLIYTAPASAFYRPFTRVIDVPIRPGGERSHLLTPVFSVTGGTLFNGVAVQKQQAACLAGISRAISPTEVPLPLLTAVLPPRWREDRWYQRFQQPPEYTAAGTLTSEAWQLRQRGITREVAWP
jgi:hypothetical protein